MQAKVLWIRQADFDKWMATGGTNGPASYA